MYIAVDFDGTVVTHEYPYVGKDIGAVPVLKKLVENNHNIILFTMRDEKELEDAIKWFKDNDIPLFGINDNPDAKWSSSRKVFANIYIDDMALGVPLKYDYNFSDRCFVDWEKVNIWLKNAGIINE